LRAQEARLLAQHLEDPAAKAAMLKIANEYDRLALRSAERMMTTIKPVKAEREGKTKELPS
jgi:hypothetical protein